MPISLSSRAAARVAAVLGLLILAIGIAGPMPARADSRTFPATGKTVRDQLLAYWDTHGGLAQQGYPISEELQERSETDGKVYTLQYFERAVFERHPENAPPYDVLLSLLGNFEYLRRYGTGGAPGQHASTDNPRYFPETKHTMGGKFRAYWETHGGLAQQGYPISDEFTEVNNLNGRAYTVQYFERAVFELHPENAGSPYEVLLSQLGTFRYQRKYAAPPATASPTSRPAPPTSTPTVAATATPAPAAGQPFCDNRPCWPPGDIPSQGGITPTPEVPNSGPGDITGTALVNGAGSRGMLILLYSSREGGLLLAAARTDGAGRYHFHGVPASTADETYYVAYGRADFDFTSSTLHYWTGPTFSYVDGTTQVMPTFELSDIQYTSSCNGEQSPLPATITWIPRSPDESYTVNILPFEYHSRWGYGAGLAYTSGDLGSANSATIPAGVLAPGQYAALIVISDPDRGTGESARPCVFDVP